VKNLGKIKKKYKRYKIWVKILTGDNIFQYISKVCEDFDHLRRSGHVCFN